MNIVVFNGSPNGPQGNTEVLIQEFLTGAREGGTTETEVVYLRDKEINRCTGCLSCWLKTPGDCIHQDDVPDLHEKMRNADVLVFASPLYVYTVTGLMKDFMDRIITLVQPFVEIKGGLCSHPLRYEGDKAVVVISNCGFCEQIHFEGMKETFRRCFREGIWPLAGMICCAAGPVLQVPEMKEHVKWYREATRKAGREVAERGCIQEETQAILDRPLVENSELYAQTLNNHFLSLGVKPIDK